MGETAVVNEEGVAEMYMMVVQDFFFTPLHTYPRNIIIISIVKTFIFWLFKVWKNIGITM